MIGIILCGLAWPVFLILVYLINEAIQDWRTMRKFNK